MKPRSKKRALVLGTSGILAALCSCQDSVAPITSDCDRLEQHPHWVSSVEMSGPRKPTVAGKFAYMGAGRSIDVLDVSDPDRPVRVATVPMNDTIYEIVVDGALAYARGQLVLYVLSLTDPAMPAVVGNEVMFDGPRGMAANGSQLYVATGAGMKVVDVSDPDAPDVVGGLTLPAVASIAALGSTVYAVHGGDVSIITAVDPSDPQVIRQLPVDELAFYSQAIVSGRMLILVPYFGNISLYDLASPTAPRLIGQAIPHVRATTVDAAVADGILYVAVSGSFFTDPTGIEAFRVTAQGNSRRLTFLPVDSMSPNGIAALQGRVLYTDSRTGLHVFASFETAAVKANAWLDVGDTALDVAAQDDHLFVAAQGSGLVVVDVSDPDRPGVIGHADTPDVAQGVAVSGPHAFVADGDSGLQIIDVTDPGAPRIVGGVDTPGTAWQVAVRGDYAYVADYFAGLQVVDVSNVTQPLIAGALATATAATDVVVDDQFAYVATLAGLQVVDISDPTAPVEIGSGSGTYAAHSVSVNGARAVLAGPDVEVIDLSTPTTPVAVGRLAGLADMRGVEVVGDVAYTTDAGGVVAVDVSFPAVPVGLGRVDAPGARRLVYHQERLYVAAGSAGIAVARPQCGDAH